MYAGVSYPPKSWKISVYQDSNDRDAQGNNFAEEDVLVSLEAENNSHEPSEFRAVVMHQFRENSQLIIECREGVFNQKLILQRGVIFSYMFGCQPLANAPQTAFDRAVLFVVDGQELLEEKPW